MFVINIRLQGPIKFRVHVSACGTTVRVCHTMALPVACHTSRDGPSGVVHLPLHDDEGHNDGDGEASRPQDFHIPRISYLIRSALSVLHSSSDLHRAFIKSWDVGSSPSAAPTTGVYDRHCHWYRVALPNNLQGQASLEPPLRKYFSIR